MSRVEFTGSSGTQLAARLELPQGEPRAYAVFAHCFTCSKDSRAATRISRALTASGIAVLRFDFTGLGESGGDFSNTDFSSNVDDLIAAASFLESAHRAPSLLIGHSLGGAAVIAAAGRLPSVRAVVTIGAPSAPEHVTALFAEALDAIVADGDAEVELAGRRFRIRRSLLDDLAEQPQLERITNLGRALLVMHSPSDDTVDIDNARRIYEAARHPKSFVALDGADHLLTRGWDATFAASMIGAWASRYALDAPGAASPDSVVPALPVGSVRVSSTPDGAYTQAVEAGAHRLIADEPLPTGNDRGPSPYDYLLAGLGACTSMTLRMYADRKAIPLDAVTVVLRHERIHADDCATCETATGMLDHIVREISLAGDLTAEQRASLMVIADKCPVHRTLTGPVQVTTTLTD